MNKQLTQIILINPHQFDFEDQSRVRRDFRSFWRLCSISPFRFDGELRYLSNLHCHERLIPSLDYLAHSDLSNKHQSIGSVQEESIHRLRKHRLKQTDSSTIQGKEGMRSTEADNNNNNNKGHVQTLKDRGCAFLPRLLWSNTVPSSSIPFCNSQHS